MVKFLVWLKHHLGFLWALIEKLNSLLFHILWSKKLKNSSFAHKIDDVEFRVLNKKDDIKLLVSFFTKQPESAFKFFNPHGFDEKSLIKKQNDPAFLMIGCFKNKTLAGYCFLRFFFNKQAFRGKIVSPEFQGQGLAKFMGLVTTQICHDMGFRLFATISKKNVKSMASSKAVNEVRVIKELADDYIYVEYLLKK